jgi:hypothetical protein
VHPKTDLSKEEKGKIVAYEFTSLVKRKVNNFLSHPCLLPHSLPT